MSHPHDDDLAKQGGRPRTMTSAIDPDSLPGAVAVSAESGGEAVARALAVLGAVQRRLEQEGSSVIGSVRDVVSDELAKLLPAKLVPGPFESRWKTLGEWGADWFTQPPPRRRWLLEQSNAETNGNGSPVGVLPLGKVGMLVSAGGVGKTMALVQLALSVATGRKWLNAFDTPNPGRVLIALGEEDEEEIRRRMYNAARAMSLTEGQLQMAAENIVALPLAGCSVPLVCSDGRTTSETEALVALRAKLSDREWRLIILDPLSRFAGGDTEKDNSAATRFVEAAESLAKSNGGPTVLLAHHTNKVSRTDDSSTSAAQARGASGLIDGVRWVANLDRFGDGARFEVTKSNYSKLSAEPVILVRDDDNSGALRVETKHEEKAREERDKANAERPKAKKNGKATPPNGKYEVD